MVVRRTKSGHISALSCSIFWTRSAPHPSTTVRLATIPLSNTIPPCLSVCLRRLHPVDF